MAQAGANASGAAGTSGREGRGSGGGGGGYGRVRLRAMGQLRGLLIARALGTRPGQTRASMSLFAPLRALLAHPEFRRGAREIWPIMPGMLAWGAVSGVAMVKSGLGVPLSLLMSLSVYSAGAQLGALTLMASGAPLWMIVAATVCVNLRFVIFSAGMRPYLLHLPFLRRVLLGYLCADLSYIMFTKRFAADRGPAPGQIPYLLGTTLCNWLGWQFATVVGILCADVIPTAWGLGYAGVLALLGLCCTLLVDRKSALAALVAFATALVTQSLPLRLNVVVAITAAVGTGALLDRWAPDPAPEPT